MVAAPKQGPGVAGKGREHGCGVKAAKGPQAEPPAARAEAAPLPPAGFLLETSFCKLRREKKPRSDAGWQRPERPGARGRPGGRRAGQGSCSLGSPAGGPARQVGTGTRVGGLAGNEGPWG